MTANPAQEPSFVDSQMIQQDRPIGLWGAETSSAAIPATAGRLRSAASTRCSTTVPAPPAMIAPGAAGPAADW
jgi:hypothetical protein